MVWVRNTGLFDDAGGGMGFATYMDNSQLGRDVQEARMMLDKVTVSVDKMNEAKQRGIKIGMELFSVAMISRQIKAIIRVRKEIETYTTAYTGLLGSQVKGAEMVKEIMEWSAKTPILFNDASRAMQLMLGFGVEEENAMKYLKALGDISMGNAERFRGLALAFAQMSAAGKLMGQDLLQMVNAGFNPLQIIAQKTGKTIGELKEDMQYGAGVMSKEVKEAFLEATAAGGKFHNMLENQSKTVFGLTQQIKSQFTFMYNDIAENNEGIIKGTLEGTLKLVSHYKELGKILSHLIFLFGEYKAAQIMVATGVKSGETAAFNLENRELEKILSEQQLERVYRTRAELEKKKVLSASQYNALLKKTLADEKTLLTEQLALNQKQITTNENKLNSLDKIIQAENIALKQTEKEIQLSFDREKRFRNDLSLQDDKIANQRQIIATTQQELATNKKYQNSKARLKKEQQLSTQQQKLERLELQKTTLARKVDKEEVRQARLEEQKAIYTKNIGNNERERETLTTTNSTLVKRINTDTTRKQQVAEAMSIKTTKAQITAQMRLQAVLGNVGNAFKNLGKFIAGEIWVIAIMGIMEVIRWVIRMRKEAKAAENAIRNIKKETADYKASMQSLIDVLKNAKPTSLAYTKTLEKIKDEYQQLSKAIFNTNGKLKENINLQDELNKLVNTEVRAEEYNKIAEKHRQIYTDKIEKLKLDKQVAGVIFNDNSRQSLAGRDMEAIENIIRGLDDEKLKTYVWNAENFMFNRKYKEAFLNEVLSTYYGKEVQKVDYGKGFLYKIYKIADYAYEYKQAMASLNAEYSDVITTSNETLETLEKVYTAENTTIDKAVVFYRQIRQKLNNLAGKTDDESLNSIEKYERQLKQLTDIITLEGFKDFEGSIKEYDKMVQNFSDLIEEEPDRFGKTTLAFQAIYDALTAEGKEFKPTESEEKANEAEELIKKYGYTIDDYYDLAKEFETLQEELLKLEDLNSAMAHPNYERWYLLRDIVNAFETLYPTETNLGNKMLSNVDDVIYTTEQYIEAVEKIIELKKQLQELQKEGYKSVLQDEVQEKVVELDNLENIVEEFRKNNKSLVEFVEEALRIAETKEKDIPNVLSKLLATNFKSSQQSIKEAKEKLLELLDYLNGVNPEKPEWVTDEEIEKLNESKDLIIQTVNKVEQLESQQYKVPFFTELERGIAKLKKAAELSKMLDKHYSGESVLSDEDLEDIEKMKSDSSEAGLKAIATASSEGAIEVAKLAEELLELSEISDNRKLKNIAESLKMITGFVGGVAEGYVKGGAKGAIIGGLKSMIGSIVDGLKEQAQYQRALEQSTDRYVKKMQLLKYQINPDDYDNIFGTNALVKAQTAWEKAKEAEQAFLTEQAELYNAGKYGEIFGEIGTIEGTGTGGRRGGGIPIQHVIYGIDIDALETLLETDETLEDNDRRRLQHALDLYNVWQENLSIVEDYVNGLLNSIAGDISKELYSSLTSQDFSFDVGITITKVERSVLDSVLQSLTESITLKWLEGYEDKLIETLMSGDYEGFISTMNEMFSPERLEQLNEQIAMLPAILDDANYRAMVFRETMFDEGISGIQSLANEWLKFIGLMYEGNDAGWDDFKKKGQMAIRDMVLQMIQQAVFQQYFDKYGALIGQMLGTEDSAEWKAKQIQLYINNLYDSLQNAAPYGQQIYDSLSGLWDGLDSLDFDPSSQGLQSVTQDSWDYTTGIVTAISITNNNIKLNTDRLVASSIEIKGHIQTLVANSIITNKHLAGIENNTAPIRAMGEQVAILRRDVQEIKQEGIKVK